MTQQVTVLAVTGQTAKVAHKRPTACHGDCEKCAGGCGSTAAKETVIVSAENLIGAQPGDQVLIEGETSKIASAIFLVYVLPIILFFAGYFLVPVYQAAAGILGFLIGIGIAVAVSRSQTRRGKEIHYRIVSFVQ